MTLPQSLSPLADPGSLCKLQILLVPVHSESSHLANQTYAHWSSLIKRHTILRGDELSRPTPTVNSHTRGSTSNPRARFLPASSSTSISRGGAPNHVHLTYPSHPPARHLANLSLLRLAAFPLVVLGIAAEEDHVEGYAVNGIEEEDEGDISAGPSTTPTVATFHDRETKPSLSDSFTNSLAELFPPTSPFPLVKRLIVVPPTSPTSPTASTPPAKGSRPGAASSRSAGKARMTDVLYAPTEGVEAWLGRLLGEVVGDVLGELGDLATALETPAGLKTLSSTLLPSLTSTLPHPHMDASFPNPSKSVTPTNDPSRPRSATPLSVHPSQSAEALSIQSSMGISLTRALTPGGRPTSIGPPSLPPIQTSVVAPTPPSAPTPASSNPFRRSSALSSPFTRSSSSNSLASSASNATVPPSPATGTKYTSAPLHGLAGGRLLKLLGDMYLLAGMYSDAIKCFDDGAERCRSVGDVLWEALAREGRAVAGIGEAWEGRDGSTMTQTFPGSPIPVEILAHFLSALACLSRAPLPYPPTILSPSPQAVSGRISFPGSEPAKPGAVGTGEGLLAYLHTGLALRISHFLLIIWASSGWGSIALSALLAHSLPRSFPGPLSTQTARDPESRRRRNRSIRQLGVKSLLSRHSIFDHAESALGPHHRAMTKPEQLALHVEVAWLARWLDLPRKEACVTREVVKRIAVMVVEAREESRRTPSTAHTKPDTPISAFSDASVGLGLGMAVSSQAVAVRRKESTDGNTGVVALFERALTLMGVDMLDIDSDTSAHPAIHALDSKNPRFGWPELQVEMMKEGIAVAEALPDHLAVVRLCISALNGLHTYLNPPSQAHVAKMIPAALAVVRRRGMELGTLPWWIPGKVVKSIELASLPPNRLPIEHSVQEIQPSEGKRDPFLYNPRLRATEVGKTVLVANEPADVFVTLQNPFACDLDIQDVSLSTVGVPFITNPLPISLPANSVQTVRITGVALTAGSMQIRGVTVRLPDGSSNEILLPLLSDREKQAREKRKSRLAADLSKSKRQGMDARWSAIIASAPELDEASQKWLECKVVEEQPLVWIKKSSLTHGTVMLFNGEASTIKITLENSSSTHVDFVKLSFEDSASKEIQAILAEGDLSGQQAHDLEYDMIKRPVFSWSAEGETVIPPGGRTTIAVTCLGKVGCTDGSIRIDYGCLKRSLESTSADDGAKSFQTRQITFPVLFTVYHTLEPHSFDLVRLLPDPARTSTDGSSTNNALLPVPSGPSRRTSSSLTPRSSSFQTIGDALLTDTLRGKMDNDHCLVGLSVRNVYGVPFEVSLSRKGQGEPVSANRLVPPGATERIFLPISRLSLTREESSKPIPTLSERQYVVDKTKKTTEQVALERELFWYREKLFSLLEATWVEPGSRRSGTLSLRDQYLSPAHLAVLRLDDLEIDLACRPRSGSVVNSTEFNDITITITNRLDRPMKPFVRIEPLPSSSLDASWAAPHTAPSRRSQSTLPAALKNVVFDGTLATVLNAIQPGESVEHRVGVVFLANGLFGFRAAVEEVPVPLGRDAPKEETTVRFSPLLRVEVE